MLMPVSKRSAKRRQKLKKRGYNTYNWAKRKTLTLSPEEIERLIAESEKAAQMIEQGEENDVQG